MEQTPAPRRSNAGKQIAVRQSAGRFNWGGSKRQQSCHSDSGIANRNYGQDQSVLDFNVFKMRCRRSGRRNLGLVRASLQ
jgi:hypothetical protein